MNRNKRTALIIFLVASAAAALLWFRPATPVAAESLRIGVNLPLSGPIAVFMDPIPAAFEQGVRASAGNRKIDFNVQDNAGTPAGAVSAYRAQSNYNFAAYVSGSTEMSNAIINQLDQAAIPHFLVAFDAYVIERGRNRLRVLPNYKLEAPLWVAAVRRSRPQRVMTLTLNNAPIQEEFDRLIVPHLQQARINVTSERFEWEGSNYALAVRRIAEARPDMILVSGYSVHLYPIIVELNRQGLNQIPTLMALDFVDLLHNGTDRRQLRNFMFTCPDFELRAPGSPAARWADAWRARTGAAPPYQAAYAYDMGQLIGRASRAGGSITRQSLMAAQPFDGVTGRVQLDAHGDLISTLGICRLDANLNPTRAF